MRVSGARTEENGIADVGTELLNMPVVTSVPVRNYKIIQLILKKIIISILY